MLHRVISHLTDGLFFSWSPGAVPDVPTSALLISSIALLATLSVTHYLLKVVQKPRLICDAASPLGRLLVRHLPAVDEYYWPPIWCSNVYLMTAISFLFRKLLPDLKYQRREYVLTPDGGQISLDWYEDPEGPQSTSIAIFFPGMTGCSKADYLKTFLPVSRRLGYRCVVFNYRGMGGTRLLTPRLYCGTADDDLSLAISHVRSSHAHPHLKLIGVGTSMGGILLARYLINTGPASALDGAMLMSVCYNYQEIVEGIERCWAKSLLNLYLTYHLISTAVQHRSWFETDSEKYNFDVITGCRTMRSFDAAFLVPMFGYRDTQEYYLDAAHKGKLGAIVTPTLALQAEDDILSPGEHLPLEEVAGNPRLAMIVTARGGHNGFMESNWRKGLRYSFLSERVLEQFLRAMGAKEDDALGAMVEEKGMETEIEGKDENKGI